jgi:hypothetical protein
MGAVRNFLDDVGRILTAKAILAFLLSTGALVVVAVRLAYLTTLVRVFAPLSYILIALIVILLALLIASGIVGIAIRLGWKPRRRPPPLPPRDAALLDVARYVARESAHGLKTFIGDNATAQMVDNELMDRIGEKGLHVWGRYGHTQLSLLAPGRWSHCTIHIANGTVTYVSEWNAIDYVDIQMNWREVRRTWPPPPL